MPDFTTAELEDALESIRIRPGPMPHRPLRRKPCRSCAVVEGFYAIYSDALKLAPEAEQLEQAKQWFCHSSPGMACRGNADNLNLIW